MVTKIRKLLVIFLIVALAAAVIVQNLDPISVQLTPSYKFSAVGGLILLAVFACGMAFALIFWVLFGIKAYFRERSLQSRDKLRESFYTSFVAARSYQSTHEWGKARDCWEQLAKKDPSNIIARIELSRSLEGTGAIREALRIIDEARAVQPHNVEILFRAAELNQVLGNMTAAIDNLALILYNHPNKLAAGYARDLSEKLGRIEDALEYHKTFEALGKPDEESKKIQTRLLYQKVVQEFEQTEELRAELRRFKRKHPEFVPALEHLAKLEAQAGNIHEAAQLLVDAAKFSESRKYWHEATRLWIENGLSERAISAALSATRNTSGLARLNAELDLIRMYLSVGKTEDAKKCLDKFLPLAKDQEVELDQLTAERHLLLRGYCLNKLGKYKEAEEAWEALCDSNFELQLSIDGQNGKPVVSAAPAPRLSTP